MYSKLMKNFNMEYNLPNQCFQLFPSFSKTFHSTTISRSFLLNSLDCDLSFEFKLKFNHTAVSPLENHAIHNNT